MWPPEIQSRDKAGFVRPFAYTAALPQDETDRLTNSERRSGIHESDII
jgi:hypothetical protein